MWSARAATSRGLWVGTTLRELRFVTRLEDLAGKTITRAVRPSSVRADLLTLLLSDGMIALLEYKDSECEIHLGSYELKVRGWTSDPVYFERYEIDFLVLLGAGTRAEVEAWVEEQNDIANGKDREKREASERAEYERLHAKYGKKEGK